MNSSNSVNDDTAAIIADTGGLNHVEMAEHSLGIASVNSRNSNTGNRTAKVGFVVVLGAIVVGALTYMGQDTLTRWKERAKTGPSKSTGADTNLLNPEADKKHIVMPKLGAAASDDIATVTTSEPDIRPLRDDSGKVMVNDKGNALGTDKSGRIVEVPPIETAGNLDSGKKPLPNAAKSVLPQGGVNSGSSVAAGNSSQQASAQTKFVSRYGGALFSDGSDAKQQPPLTPQPPMNAQTALEKAAAIIAQSNTQSGQGFGASAPTQKTGSIGAALGSSSTPAAVAKRMPDQSLTLPKGRQADCILTTRIIDEVPGFASCVLAENMYSADGTVLLLERGSSVDGEYGTTGQQGLRRLFVTWSRARTPGGIEIDWSSPGTDSLGGSGLPGFLDKRWGERIGAAFMLSIFKDTLAVWVASRTQSNNSASNGTVVVQQPPPGQSTVQTGQNIADKVLEDGMKARPTLSINQGERISIYVARDLDFSGVYRLRTIGTPGSVKLN